MRTTKGFLLIQCGRHANPGRGSPQRDEGHRFAGFSRVKKKVALGSRKVFSNVNRVDLKAQRMHCKRQPVR